MGTRSLIAQKIDDKYKTIYCHYGGYLSHQLNVLNKHYSVDACELWHAEARLTRTNVATLLQNKLDILLERRLSAINDDGSLEIGMHYDKNDVDDHAQFFNARDLVESAQWCSCEYIYIYDDDIWHVVNTNNPLLNQTE